MEQIMEKESFWRQFNSLPSEARREVIDFIAFLLTRYQRSNPEKHPQTSKLSDESFIGIWKDREDLKDSVAWIRDVRKKEWAA
jgi:hypothetical protein